MVWVYLSFNLKALRWRLLGQMEGSVTQLVQKEKELSSAYTWHGLTSVLVTQVDA